MPARINRSTTCLELNLSSHQTRCDAVCCLKAAKHDGSGLLTRIPITLVSNLGMRTGWSQGNKARFCVVRMPGSISRITIFLLRALQLPPTIESLQKIPSCNVLLLLLWKKKVVVITMRLQLVRRQLLSNLTTSGGSADNQDAATRQLAWSVIFRQSNLENVRGNTPCIVRNANLITESSCNNNVICLVHVFCASIRQDKQGAVIVSLDSRNFRLSVQRRLKGISIFPEEMNRLCYCHVPIWIVAFVLVVAGQS